MTESRFDAHRGGSALTPLVGREEELDLLLRRWSQARDGEGQVVLLSGEPGIGKSRILSALRERLDAQGVQALRFQCSPYYVNSAFWPIIDNFERTLKIHPRRNTGVETRQAGSAGRYAVWPTAGRRPFVASILSIPCEERYGALAMTPQKHKDETLRTLVDISEAIARRQPSVLLFEDAHWADPTTLEVLDLLIDRVRTVPLLIVLTHRPEFQSRWSGQGHVGALNLSKLTRTQSAAMVSGLAGGKALPEGLLEQILTRTDGVPLFVEELTRSILEIGRAEGRRRSLPLRWFCSNRHYPGDTAELVDGAAGSFHAGEGDRPDRGGDWPRIQIRADCRCRADATGPTRRFTRAADRIGTGLPSWHAA